MSNSKLRNHIKKSNILPITIVTVFSIMALYFVGTMLFISDTASATNNTNKIDLKGPQKTQTLNKEFLFPLKGPNGEEVSKLKFIVEDAEVRDEIVIKGQKATAISGRSFLILNLKITNDYDKAIQINARDYIRLQTGNNDEKLAPDIHNDPVEIQAISTKFTRVGFPIDTDAKNLKLIIGEISGDKKDLNLNLK